MSVACHIPMHSVQLGLRQKLGAHTPRFYVEVKYKSIAVPLSAVQIPGDYRRITDFDFLRN
jgi:hypothetical protein